MSSKLQTLREERDEVTTRIKQMRDTIDKESRTFTGEEDENWDHCTSDYDALTKSIEIEEQIEKVTFDECREDPMSSRMRHSAGARHVAVNRMGTPTREDRDNALQAWCLTQVGEKPSEGLMDSAFRCGIKPSDTAYEVPVYDTLQLRQFSHPSMNPWEQRALSTTGTTSGGHIVPTGFVNALEISLLAFGGMRQTADVIRTPTGADLPWPTSNDTSNKGEIITENSAVNTQDVAFGQVVFSAFKYSSKLVKVSVELIQDSAFNLASVLGAMLGERIGRIQNDHFTTGDASAKPNGIVTASSVGVTSAVNGTSGILADEILDLIHSVDPAYRNQPGAGFMMNDAIVKVVRKLKDSNGQYLWEPSIQRGQPAALWSYPVVTNQSMTSTSTSGQKIMVFGALGKYKIRDVQGIRVRRLVERFADNDQEGFMAFFRSDGDLLDSGTDPVKHYLMST